MDNKYKIIKEELDSGDERFLLLLDMGKLNRLFTFGVLGRYVCLKDFETKKEALEHLSRMEGNGVVRQTTVFDSQDSQKVKE